MTKNVYISYERSSLKPGIITVRTFADKKREHLIDIRTYDESMLNNSEEM